MQCSQCGTRRVAPTTALDLCPRCLLATALAMEDEPCPYQVLAPIGEGSNGVTYLAQAVSGMGGYVALKILKPRDDVDAVLSRYRYWQAVLARITHPSVNRLLDVGLTAGGRLYVASEYVAGWPLDSLGSHAAIGSAERLELARQLTGAIDVAHQFGVVHLDLDASKVKVSMAAGLQASILGLGSRMIVDGVAGVASRPDLDRLALGRIVRLLGVEV